MKKEAFLPTPMESVAQVHKFLGIPGPSHPMVSLIDLSSLNDGQAPTTGSFINSFYSIFIKKDFTGKLRYGQQYCDFDHGVMLCFAPGQVIAIDHPEESVRNGWWLLFHADFIRGYDLGRKIREYGYFSYEVNEALHLSESEERKITSTMQVIAEEYRQPIDRFSQDVIVAHIDVLLNYTNRYYNRQFITRKPITDDVLIQLEQVLDDYFAENKPHQLGLPSVQYVSALLHLSPNYLSDKLRAATGQSTQQHIQNRVITQAKEILASSSLPIKEIAFQLGFEYPQSFSALFKNKT